MRSRGDRTLMLGMTIAGLLALLGVVAAIWWVADPRIFPGCKLDEFRWERAKRNVQGRLVSFRDFETVEEEVEDLVKCDDLVYGKTRSEVETLLGPPDRRSQGFWFYDVGVPGDLSDYPALGVKFNSSGTAQTVEVSGYVER